MNVEDIIYKKPRWVSGALILVAGIIMFVAVQKTVSLSSTYFSLRHTMESLEDFSQEEVPRNAQLSFEEQDMNAVLFKTISESARKNKLSVRNISTPVTFQTEDMVLLTGEVILEGDFVNAIMCLDQIHQELKSIKISSIKFERDLSPKNEALYIKAYFQMIKKNESEKRH